MRPVGQGQAEEESRIEVERAGWRADAEALLKELGIPREVLDDHRARRAREAVEPTFGEWLRGDAPF